jgi:uncharacterized protein YbjT (DUF2867 family)
MARTAWIAGASGLVGGFALERLLEDGAFDRVVSFGRRASGRGHAKLEERVVDFAAFDASDAPAPDVALCALGTTIARAGSREAFRAVDHDAVLAFARGAHARGARAFVVVTAHGADARSAVFYNRVKGEVEEALRAVGFDSLVIARPSLLLGDRAERRRAEHAAVVVSRALRPLLRPFRARPVEAAEVGSAIAKLARDAPSGVHVVHSAELHAARDA